MPHFSSACRRFSIASTGALSPCRQAAISLSLTSKQLHTCRPRAATGSRRLRAAPPAASGRRPRPAAPPAAAAASRPRRRCRRRAGSLRAGVVAPAPESRIVAALAAARVGVVQARTVPAERRRPGRAALRSPPAIDACGRLGGGGTEQHAARARGRTARSARRRSRAAADARPRAPRAHGRPAARRAPAAATAAPPSRPCTAACFSSGCFDCGQKADCVSALTPARRAPPRPPAPPAGQQLLAPVHGDEHLRRRLRGAALRRQHDRGRGARRRAPDRRRPGRAAPCRRRSSRAPARARGRTAGRSCRCGSCRATGRAAARC